MWNPLSIAGSWRIDPDNRQDRGCSEVKSYKLPPEEIEKLIKSTVMPARKKPQAFSQSVSQIKRTKMEADEFMSKITIEQLTSECQKLGFTKEAYKDIANRYGFSNYHSVECAVSKHGIKKLLENEGVQVEKVDNTENVKRQEEPGTYLEQQPVIIVNSGIHDSGKREECITGAVRDTQVGKGRFDLITPEGLFRLARWYELGADKYAERNWEKGIPVTRCISSAFRHLVKYMAGYRDEDHLAAVAWNVFAIMHFERLMPELDDRPEWARGGYKDEL